MSKIPWHKWPNPTMVVHLVAIIWVVQVFGPPVVQF